MINSISYVKQKSNVEILQAPVIALHINMPIFLLILQGFIFDGLKPKSISCVVKHRVVRRCSSYVEAHRDTDTCTYIEAWRETETRTRVLILKSKGRQRHGHVYLY